MAQQGVFSISHYPGAAVRTGRQCGCPLNDAAPDFLEATLKFSSCATDNDSAGYSPGSTRRREGHLGCCALTAFLGGSWTSSD